GLAHLYRPAAALGALTTGLALAGRELLSARDRRAFAPLQDRALEARSGWAPVASSLTALMLAVAFVAALAPPTAKDTLQYHGSLPKAFIASGGLAEVPGNLANYFALGAEMHGVWAMLLGRMVSARAEEAAFGAIMFAFFPLLLAAVFGWARERGVATEWCWVAAAMVASVPTIVEVAGSGYVDLALTVYVALAVRSLARWWHTGDRARLAESALTLGFALSVKLTAAFVVLLFALLVLARTRQPAAERTHHVASFLSGVGALGVPLVLGSPWYLRTWVRTGSPFFPFLADIWPGSAQDWDL